MTPTNDTVLQALLKTDKVTVVDFYADWCVPCTNLSPIFEKIASDYADKANFAKVDIEQSELPAQFGVRSIPTIILFKDQIEVARTTGIRSYTDLTTLMDTHVVGPNGSPE